MATSIGTPGVVFPDGRTQSVATPGAAVVTAYFSPSTWTKPTGLKYIKVTVIASGSPGGTGGPAIGGGGGGGGGIAQGTYPAPSLSPSYVVTVGGPAAPSSVGALVSATTGVAGTAGPGGGGGTGGVGSGGQINMYGIAGAPSYGVATGGIGGVANLFTGFPGTGGGPGAAGGNGSGFGSGGGGAGSNNATAGTGSPGRITIEEYY